MQVTKEGIEAVKAANELLSVVAERGIELRKKGRVAVARCPFHEEKTASFTITPSKGLYHCFGCGAAGDVIGFVTKYDRVSFGSALETLAKRAGLPLSKLMEDRPRILLRTPLSVLTPPPSLEGNGSNGNGRHASPAPSPAMLSRVVDHYHRTFCERERRPGIPEEARPHGPGPAARSQGRLRRRLASQGDPEGRRASARQLVSLGVDHEPRGASCSVAASWSRSLIPSRVSGRPLRPRHEDGPALLPAWPAPRCLELPIRAHERGSHPDRVHPRRALFPPGRHRNGDPDLRHERLYARSPRLLKREGVKRVILALDNDDAGRKASGSIKEKLAAAGIAVRVACFPEGIKDANDLLVSRERRRWPKPSPRSWARPSRARVAGLSPLSEKPALPSTRTVPRSTRDGLAYSARVQSSLLGRLRVTVKVTRGDVFHVDTLDLYASRSRSEFAKRVSKVFSVEAASVEAALLALVVEAEKKADRDEPRRQPARGHERRRARRGPGAAEAAGSPRPAGA